MARRQNPEKYLRPELEAAIAHGPEPVWPDGGINEYLQTDHDDLVKSLDTQGSANWPPLAHATRFLRFTGEAFRKERDKWLGFFDTSKRRFMGREVGSRIYLGWHFLPVCAVWESAERSGDSTVATEAKNWLLFVAAWFGVCTDDLGGLYWLGQRSAGHQPKLRWQDALRRVVVSGHDDLGWYKSDSWEDTYLKQLAPKLQRLTKTMHNNRAEARRILALLNYRTLVPYHLYRTVDGMAVWTDKRINGNTDAVLARVDDKWLPPNCGFDQPGNRLGTPAECIWVNNELRYTSKNYGNHALAMPAGPPLEYFVWGGETGYKDLLEAHPIPPPPLPSDPEPPKPPKPNKPSWIERMGI